MVGFNLCFFPMHFLGLSGLPRRVCSFDPSFIWLNSFSSWGALVSVVRAFFLVFVLWESFAVGHRVLGIWEKPTVPFHVFVVPLCHHEKFSRDGITFYPKC